MPNHFEKIPDTSDNLQFPGGDIDRRAYMRGHDELRRLYLGNAADQRQKLRMLRMMETPAWRHMRGQEAILEDVKLLAQAWGTAKNPISESGPLTVKTGFISSMAFIKKTRLLPVEFGDFSEQMLAMNTYTHADITFFADEAWHCMGTSHPRLYGVLAPFTRHVRDMLDLYDHDSLVLLDAGVVLPYVMTSTTCMGGYLRDDLEREIPTDNI